MEYLYPGESSLAAMWTTHTILYSVTGGSSQATTPTSPTPPRQHDSGRYSVVSEQLGTRPLAGTSPFLAGYSEARQRLSERQQHYHRPAGTVREPSFIAWAVGKVRRLPCGQTLRTEARQFWRLQ